MVEHNELEEKSERAEQRVYRAAEAVRRAQRGVKAGTMSEASIQRARNVWRRSEAPWQILSREQTSEQNQSNEQSNLII